MPVSSLFFAHADDVGSFSNLGARQNVLQIIKRALLLLLQNLGGTHAPSASSAPSSYVYTMNIKDLLIIIFISRILISRILISWILISRILISWILISRILISRILISGILISWILISRILISRILISGILISRILISRILNLESWILNYTIPSATQTNSVTSKSH